MKGPYLDAICRPLLLRGGLHHHFKKYLKTASHQQRHEHASSTTPVSEEGAYPNALELDLTLELDNGNLDGCPDVSRTVTAG
jgi:hypothetical protein